MLKKKKPSHSKLSSSSNSTSYSEGPSIRAHKIVNERSQEQERRHGPFSLGMERTAVVASILTNKTITAEDCYKVLIALKISRLANSIELDSATDLCGYVEGLWNYKQEITEKDVIALVKRITENDSFKPNMIIMNPKDAKKLNKVIKERKLKKKNVSTK
jgi:hypothetical protein